MRISLSIGGALYTEGRAGRSRPPARTADMRQLCGGRETPWRRHRSPPIRRGSPAAWRGARSAKARFSAASSVALGAALEHLGDKGAARRQHGLRAKAKAVLGQRDDAQMVGRGVAGRRRRHVAQHEIGRAAERRADRRQRLGVEEIAAAAGSRRARIGRQRGRCRRRAPLGADALGRDLASSRPARSRDRRRACPAAAGGTGRRAAISLKAARER